MTDTPHEGGPANQRPPPANAGRARHPIFEHAESLGKLATVVVGVLYVLGLLISNIQLMELGISDFASLQTRNILTGFFFLFYVMFLVSALMPIVVLAVLCARTLANEDDSWRHKAFRCAWLTVGLLFVAAIAVGFAGTVIGFLYPWGNSFEAEFVPGVTISTKDVGTNGIRLEYLPNGISDSLIPFRQFVAAYAHFKILFASFVIGCLIAVFFPNLEAAWSRLAGRGNEKEAPRAAPATRVAAVVVSLVYLALAFPALMFGYADEVYPNLNYNLGGGQPQVAELVLTGKRADIAGLNLFGLQAARLCCDDDGAEQTVRTGDVAVWYQSDKFMYVSSLNRLGPEPIRLHVIDLKLVRSMRYLPKNIEVFAGGSIKSIYERTAKGFVVVATASEAGAATHPVIWAQVRPDDKDTAGQLIARTVVAPDSQCPEASFEGPKYWKGKAWRMQERWEAADGPFPIKVCEIAYPGHLALKVGDTLLKVRSSDPRKILVIGDTGCRIKDATELQDCLSADAWPFHTIAEKAAALDPDLIVHVGDYHYREALCPDPAKCAGSPHGDNWEVWHKDFFEPAAPLLARAPWLMVRGNHEGWTRAGSGWRLLLSPFGRGAIDEPWADEAAPYTVRFGDLSMAVLDVANAGDAQAPDQRREKYERWVQDLSAPRGGGAARREERWLLDHNPPWVSFKCATAPCAEPPVANDPLEAIRAWLRGGSSGMDLMLAGDTHMFQFFVPDAPAIPPQIVAGMAGDLLEPRGNYGDVLDKAIDASLFNVPGRLWMHHGFGFLMLIKDDAGWAGTFYDTAGSPKLRCDLKRATLDKARVDFPCRPL